MLVEDEAETKKFGLVPKQTTLAHGAPALWPIVARYLEGYFLALDFKMMVYTSTSVASLVSRHDALLTKVDENLSYQYMKGRSTDVYN